MYILKWNGLSKDSVESEMLPYPLHLDISRAKGYYFSQETIIGGLLPETTYSVTIAAYTTKGDGARSKSKLVTTTGAGEPCVQWLNLLMQKRSFELAEIFTSQRSLSLTLFFITQIICRWRRKQVGYTVKGRGTLRVSMVILA